MANESAQAIQLQLAMAFGQGTGAMMAEAEALRMALDGQTEVVGRALKDWGRTSHTLFQLVRLIGQIAATHAALDRVPEIQRRHVELAIPVAMIVCPCSEKTGV